MARKKSEEEKVKKVDIFSLYQKDTFITLSDDQGRSTTILLEKLTQGERQKLLDTYIDIVSETKAKFEKKDKESGYYTRAMDGFDRNQLEVATLSYEKAQRGQIADIFPVENEDELTEKKKDELERELADKWETGRRGELSKMATEEIRTALKTMTLDALALIESGRQFDLMSLHLMCKDPETRELIFKSKEDVEKIVDKRILDALLAKLTEIRQMETMQDVRKASEDPDFLQPGESPKNSAGSQNTTPVKS